jgi:nitrous-oxide reductase
MKHWKKIVFVVAVIAGLVAACSGGPTPTPEGAVGIPQDAAAVAAQRGLTPADITAALKTYMPSGQTDPYIMFSSGGQGGQVLVIGVPSMRILRIIGVFSPESWQGYGYGGGGDKVLAEGYVGDQEIKWGDTHHPGLSETEGEYDGQFLFINDKANARVAVIDLRDFETKQIVKNPNAIVDHGGSFVTPNTEYVIEGPQYATPIGWGYAPLSEYKDKYRGVITFWKFDREKGRIDEAQSFQIELPPYWQDLCDAGKKVSEGWIFCNSFNTEMATGEGPDGTGAPYEAGTTQNDTDYLHIINWKAAEAAFKAGKGKDINGISVIPLETAISDKLLFFTPEPKSPHGADVTPGGEYVVVGGKLDPHVTVYSFDKIQKAIAAGPTEKDAFGVPVLKLDDTMEAQVELGLGPLHTVYDDKGYAYTSMFLDSAVARWTLGGPYADKHPEQPWTLVQKLPVHYNIGHIAAAEGDTASPDGQYVVALDKWSIDRFANVGPLMPQNFQLVDVSQTGDKMQLLYDMPIGMAEPHYAQIIKADKLKPWQVYPEVGWNPDTQSVDPNAVKSGEERIERNGNNVEVFMTVVRSHYKPDLVELKKGDKVKWHLTSLERTPDATHGFAIPGYNINLSLEPGEAQTVEFEVNQDGTFPFYCTEFCSALHLEMVGQMLVKP